MAIKKDRIEKALLVQVVVKGADRKEAEDSLEELGRLAETVGANVAGSITQRRDKPTPSFFIGEGKVADVQLACRQSGADVVIFDNELSPVQVNNLDLSLGIKVIDRTELILQIFARRARSAEAQIQVELAQLQYLVSRIPVSRKQQRFQGGIGMRGPGESPLQLRNEPMRRRIKDLKKKLKAVRRQSRQARSRRPWPLVSLVGYTNAGKSTLLNAFTSADAYVDDRLFATLDTKTRLVHLQDANKILMTDTVGFIRHLPHGLVASFRSTLEVAAESDLLLIVADTANPHLGDHLDVVSETLKEINADHVPSMLLLNKIDRLDANGKLPEITAGYPSALPVSAKNGTGLDELREQLSKRLKDVVHSSYTNR
jgi:GTP-binding protein HflX